jgi:TPR repeat protein
MGDVVPGNFGPHNGEESETWKEAQALLRKRDYAKAADLLHRMADAGEWWVLPLLGLLYERGEHGVARDVNAAASCYRRAIFEADDAAAHLDLARLYWNGDFGVRDFAHAREHYEMAFHGGKVEAALYLGMIYLRGLGVPIDHSRARPYLEAAAESGFALALGLLGTLQMKTGSYLKGRWLTTKGLLLSVWLSAVRPTDRRLFGLKVYEKYRK